MLSSFTVPECGQVTERGTEGTQVSRRRTPYSDVGGQRSHLEKSKQSLGHYRARQPVPRVWAGRAPGQVLEGRGGVVGGEGMGKKGLPSWSRAGAGREGCGVSGSGESSGVARDRWAPLCLARAE